MYLNKVARQTAIFSLSLLQYVTVPPPPFLFPLNVSFFPCGGFLCCILLNAIFLLLGIDCYFCRLSDLCGLVAPVERALNEQKRQKMKRDFIFPVQYSSAMSRYIIPCLPFCFFFNEFWNILNNLYHWCMITVHRAVSALKCCSRYSWLASSFSWFQKHSNCVVHTATTLTLHCRSTVRTTAAEYVRFF